MLIDKPRCNFKNCRYCFDGNCYSADKYENCQLTDLHNEIAKLTVDLDNAKDEVAREIIGIIDKRMELKTEQCKGVHNEIVLGVYRGQLDAYQDIKEIIKQKYTEENEKT